MAKVRTSSREDAMKIARYLGCSGAHQDDKGNWMPCSSHEKLIELSEQAAEKSALKRDKKKRRRYINKDWENLREGGVLGIDTLEGGGLVSGLQKSLTQWFKEEWVDISRPKKGGGFEPCGRSDADKGKYPKCVPAARASQMSDEEIRSAITRKRRAESTQTRVDKKPIYVPTKKKDDESALEEKSAIPTNPDLYERVKAEAKKKFDVYPSAYANAWLVREYKKRGGGYRSGKSDYGDFEDFVEDLTEMQLSDLIDWVDEKAATSTIIIGRAKPRIGDPDVYSDPNAARLRARKLGCIGIARRETPDGEIVWTPCTNVSDQRRRQGETPLGRRDESRRFADMLQEVGGPARKRQRMRKYKSLLYSIGYKQLRSIGSQLRMPWATVGRNVQRAGKCRGGARGIRSIRDGDGDGFICNPATGDDDLPIVGNDPMLQRFFKQLTEDKKGWAKKLKDNPFRADDTSFNTDGGSDQMLKNLANRGWIIEDEGGSIRIIPPPEFRKRYLAMRAVRGESAVDSIEKIFNIGYHKWHPGNNPIGPEKELARKLLKNFGYDPLNDTLYSPYYDTPNGYGQIRNPNQLRKYANGVIPEFEGAPNAEKYLSDKPNAPEFKKPSIVDEQLGANIARLNDRRRVEQYENLVEAGKQKYGNRNRERKLDIDSPDFADEFNDFVDLHDADYGVDEIAEILNIDEENLTEFMNAEGFNVAKGNVLELKRRFEREEELRRLRRAQGVPPQGKPKRPQKAVGFRENAVPPKNTIDPNATGPFTLSEFEDAVAWITWQNKEYFAPIRFSVLQQSLNDNPRLKELIREMHPVLYASIFQQDRGIAQKQKDPRIINLHIEYWKKHIAGIVGAKNDTPKVVAQLGIPKPFLRQVVDIITSADNPDIARAELEKRPELWKIYDDLSFFRIFPPMKDAPKGLEVFAGRPKDTTSDEDRDLINDNGAGEVTSAVKQNRIDDLFAKSLDTSPSSSLDDSTMAMLAEKVSAHNEMMRSANKPAWSMASIAKAKEVYRRGSMDRVKTFFSLLKTGRPNNGRYVGDNDLLHEDHPWKKRGVRQKSALHSEGYLDHKALPTISRS